MYLQALFTIAIHVCRIMSYKLYDMILHMKYFLEVMIY